MSDPTTHDYRRPKRGWGHDYTVSRVHDNGMILDMLGWGYGIRQGDFLLLESKSESGETRYRVKEVQYLRDPSDMWNITAEFAPRG